MRTIKVNFSTYELKLLEKYAQKNNASPNQILRHIILEKLIEKAN